MNPVFVDIHIHTSENPNSLNNNYDVVKLIEKVRDIGGDDFLISLSDHNTINKRAYASLLEITKNVILSTELHIRNYDSKPAYHCHILFNLPHIFEQEIDNLNQILDTLYPNKLVQKDTHIPNITDIINSFDKYDFLLLPHGGQSHSTFDKSIPSDAIFDKTLERSIYYNQFDGFTARSNDGLEETKEYFKRLGINDFVNLLTCSDNYNPSIYPQAKIQNAADYIPTWMLASPTFEGLRLSLSEASRFVYSTIKPQSWEEHIEKVKLDNEKIHIDVNLTPGLNVVIGGSSSGKTLFVDSIYKKLCDDFEGSNYSDYDIKNIEVVNKSSLKPHYIYQNFITTVLASENKTINEIDMISQVFPLDTIINKQIQQTLQNLKCDIYTLIDNAKHILELRENLLRIPTLSHLLITGEVKCNIISLFFKTSVKESKIRLEKADYDLYKTTMDRLYSFMINNPFCSDISEQISYINSNLHSAFMISEFEKEIKDCITKYKNSEDIRLSMEDSGNQIKTQNKENLFKFVSEYITSLNNFQDCLDKIAKYNVKFETKSIVVMGHELSIENCFHLSKDSILDAINKYIKPRVSINKFEDISPERLRIDNFKKKSPKIESYDALKKIIYAELEKTNNKKYNIKTNDGQNFDNLSPGWKSAVLLDIILGYKEDIAPLIIDQPEDNLATNYINTNLINTVKIMKNHKQIILVSHNATIPMLGDAQNIILCQNENGKINIQSQPLEGNISGKSMVDYIAEITDGGKPSIKKRVKKYNLKKFREDSHENQN